MIYLSEKISTNNNKLNKTQFGTKSKLASFNKTSENDQFIPQDKQPKNSKKDNQKYTIAYAVGGLLAVAGIIFAIVKHRRATVLPGNVGQDIVGSARDLGQSAPKNPTHSPSQVSSTSNRAPVQEIIENDPEVQAITSRVQNTEQELADARELEAQSSRRLEEQARLNQERDVLEAQLEQVIMNRTEEIIGALKPENEGIAREVIPKLIKNRDALGVNLSSIEDFNTYLSHITPENKDFAINEGIPFIAERMERMKGILQEPHKAHELLDVLTPESKEFISRIVEEAEKYKIKTIKDIKAYVEEIKPANREFALGEVMPLILQHNDRLKIESGRAMADVLGHITPETKDIIATVTDNTERLGLEGSFSTSQFILAITPENKKNIVAVANNALSLGIPECFASDDYRKILDGYRG